MPRTPRTQTVFPLTRTTREVRERAPLQGQGVGFTTVPVGTEEVYYETLIDLDKLDEIARRAATNQNGRAVDGALIVVVRERKRIAASAGMNHAEAFARGRQIVEGDK